MAKVLVKVRVAYPSDFMDAVYRQAAVRERYGEVDAEYLYMDNDLNVVVCLLGWNSVDSAKEFWSSRRAAALIAEWHAVGTPEILVLEKIERPAAASAEGLRAEPLFRIVAVVSIAASLVAGHANDPHTHLAYSTERAVQSSMTLTSTGSPSISSTFTLVSGSPGSTGFAPKG